MARGPLPEAWRHMAEVEHVVEPGAPAMAGIPSTNIPTPNTSGRTAGDRNREVLEFVGRKVLNAGVEIAKEKGVEDCVTALEDGNPVKRILDYADKEDANLIVMGSRGLSDFNGLLMGSVSHKISHLAKCTCITVK